jgi:hypothetical protein
MEIRHIIYRADTVVLSWCSSQMTPDIPAFKDLQHVMGMAAYQAGEVAPCVDCLKRIRDVTLTEIERYKG